MTVFSKERLAAVASLIEGRCLPLHERQLDDLIETIDHLQHENDVKDVTIKAVHRLLDVVGVPADHEGPRGEFETMDTTLWRVTWAARQVEAMAFAKRMNGFEGRPCPLCTYKEGGYFVESCGLHKIVSAYSKMVSDLQDGIRKHRDQRGHDRCTLDDDALYALLGEEDTSDRTLPPKDDFLAGCAKFWEARQTGVSAEHCSLPQVLTENEVYIEALKAEQLFEDFSTFWNEENPDALLHVGWAFGDGHDGEGKRLYEDARTKRHAALKLREQRHG